MTQKNEVCSCSNDTLKGTNKQKSTYKETKITAIGCIYQKKKNLKKKKTPFFPPACWVPIFL
jgi:hypothetical protein